MALEDLYVPSASGPSAPGGAALVNIRPRGGYRVQIGFCHVSYSAAPAAGNLKISDGAGGEFDIDINAAGLSAIALPGDGLTFENGQAVTATLAGGGGAVVAKLSLGYRYRRER